MPINRILVLSRRPGDYCLLSDIESYSLRIGQEAEIDLGKLKEVVKLVLLWRGLVCRRENYNQVATSISQVRRCRTRVMK